MDAQKKGQIRHILTTLGGVITALGWADAGVINNTIDIAMQLIGPAMIIWGMVWSWIDPSKK